MIRMTETGKVRRITGVFSEPNGSQPATGCAVHVREQRIADHDALFGRAAHLPQRDLKDFRVGFAKPDLGGYDHARKVGLQLIFPH